MLKILISLSLLSVFSLAYTLKQSYELYEPRVYSTDLIPKCERKFFILNLPQNQSKYEHPAHEIRKIFKQFGCELDEGETFARVTFHLKSNAQCLVDDMSAYFENLYPSIQINAISIQSNRYFDCDKEYFIESIPQRHTGTIIVNQEGERYFFRYDVDAKVQRLVSQTPIERGESLTPSNTSLQFVEFRDLQRNYIHNIDNLVAKYRIQEGRELTSQMVMQKPDVRQGHTVRCRYTQNNITIEFEARALSDGIIGDEIRVQKGLKQYRARIIGHNLVEIL